MLNINPGFLVKENNKDDKKEAFIITIYIKYFTIGMLRKSIYE